MREEIWKDIEGYEGLYQVSNLGRVKSLERMKMNNGGYQKVTEKILEGLDNGHGYLFVILYKDGKGNPCRINRLVAQAFLPNPDNLPIINHKDENPKNNCMDNLEWCSYSYNNSYNDKGKKIGKKLSKPVIGINKVSGLILEFPSTREAERQTGISNGSICNCLKGRRNSAGGFYWIYADDDNE